MGSARHLVAVALAGSVLLAVPAAGGAADGELALDAELGAGADSNPERALRQPGRADGFASLLLRGTWRLHAERFGLTVQLAEAGRLYAGTDATALGSRLDAQAAYALEERLTLGATVVASDLTERGHRLDQDLLDALATLAWSPGALRLRAGGGWTVFSPRDAPLRPFLSSGPRAAASAGWALDSDQLLSVGYELAAPSYPRWRELAGTARDDRTHTLSAELAHRGAFLAAVGYAYAWNRSSAPGGAFQRHRVHARAAVDLSGEVTLAVRGALQWSTYPEPLFLAQQLLLSDGQQNLDSLEVRLTHALAPPLDLIFSLALYRAEAAIAPGDVPSFTRVVGSIAIGWRSQWSSMTGTP